MNKRRRTKPDWKNGNPFIDLWELLANKKLSVATLANAIDEHGIYYFDGVGRFRLANKEDKAKAFHLLELQYEWESDPSVKYNEEPRSPLEYYEGDPDSPYIRFGWASEVLPDFEKIRQKQKALDEGKLESHTLQKQQCATFLAMENLVADEVSITFVGDKSEFGIEANNLLEISARGETKRVALAELGLIDLHRNRLNSQCAVLLGMIQRKKLTNTGPNKKKVSRLREIFRTNLGIDDDPFDPYRKNVGREPRFKIYDKRGAVDERARQEGERRSISHDDQGKYSSKEIGATNQMRQFLESENDDTAEWLKNHDPRYKA